LNRQIVIESEFGKAFEARRSTRVMDYVARRVS
jgi:hypothetical protein